MEKVRLEPTVVPAATAKSASVAESASAAEVAVAAAESATVGSVCGDRE